LSQSILIKFFELLSVSTCVSVCVRIQTWTPTRHTTNHLKKVTVIICWCRVGTRLIQGVSVLRRYVCQCLIDLLS